jgi:hypothetical protein
MHRILVCLRHLSGGADMADIVDGFVADILVGFIAGILVGVIVPSDLRTDVSRHRAFPGVSPRCSLPLSRAEPKVRLRAGYQ